MENYSANIETSRNVSSPKRKELAKRISRILFSEEVYRADEKKRERSLTCLEKEKLREALQRLGPVL